MVALGIWRSLGSKAEARPFFRAIGLFILPCAGVAISLIPMIVPNEVTPWEAASAPRTRNDDLLFGDAVVRQGGRAVHAMYLVEVKKPEESHYPWDYYKILKIIPGEEAFRPLSEGGCPLLAKP